MNAVNQRNTKYKYNIVEIQKHKNTNHRPLSPASFPRLQHLQRPSHSATAWKNFQFSISFIYILLLYFLYVTLLSFYFCVSGCPNQSIETLQSFKLQTHSYLTDPSFKRIERKVRKQCDCHYSTPGPTLPLLMALCACVLVFVCLCACFCACVPVCLSQDSSLSLFHPWPHFTFVEGPLPPPSPPPCLASSCSPEIKTHHVQHPTLSIHTRQRIFFNPHFISIRRWLNFKFCICGLCQICAALCQGLNMNLPCD